MKERFVEVPFKKLAPETLKALITEYIERDGTFYGEVELSMEQKIEMVIEQVENGVAVITWDLDLESSNIVLKNDFKRRSK